MHCSKLKYIFIFTYRTVVLYGTLVPALCVLVLFTYLCWADGNGCCFTRTSESDTPTSVETMDRCISPSQVVASSRGIRLSIFLVSVMLIAISAVITLVRASLYLYVTHTHIYLFICNISGRLQSRSCRITDRFDSGR